MHGELRKLKRLGMEGSGRVKKRKEIGGDGLPRRLRLLAMTWGGGEVGADSPWIPAGVGSVRRAAPTVWTGIGAYCPHVRKDLPPAGEGAPVRTLGRMMEKAARAAAPESERLADTLPHLSQATSSPAGGGTESRRGLDPTVWTGIGARNELRCMGEGKDPSTPLRFAQDDRSGAGKRLGAKR